MLRSTTRARGRHTRALARCAGLVWACSAAACQGDVQVTVVALELRAPAGCEVGELDRLELRALGDFQPRRELVEGGTAAASLDGLPLATRELAIEGWFAGGLRAGGRTGLGLGVPGEPLPLVLLPERTSCPLGDSGLASGEGAAASALPGGGLLLAGGTHPDGTVLSSAVVLPAGHLLIDQVPEGMLLRRRAATATAVGGLVVVAGGASDARGDAEQTYEVFDVARGAFARELSRQLATGPRMEHGAALLGDGSVLLAGGRAEPSGEPLASAELVRLEAPEPRPLSDLNLPRVSPAVLVLDSGAVVVAGGRDREGAPVTRIERLEAATRRFVTLDLELEGFESAAAVALPGARVAWVGCDASARGACALQLVLLRGEEPVVLDVALDWQTHAPRGLTELRAVATEDGRILLTGRDADGGRSSRALLLDLEARSIESVPASRAPQQLLALADGVVAELDAFGASLRRLGTSSAFDSPEGNLLDVDARWVVLDAADRWQRSSAGWRALVSGARLDVARLRLGDFRAELRLEGVAVLRVRAPDAPELTVRIDAAVAPAPGCPALGGHGAVFLERRGGSLRAWSERGAGSACALRWSASERAALAIEAEVDSVLRGLRITRL